jgi:hypothetical protein
MDEFTLPTHYEVIMFLRQKMHKNEVEPWYHENLQNQYKLFKYVTTSPSPKFKLHIIQYGIKV